MTSAAPEMAEFKSTQAPLLSGLSAPEIVDFLEKRKLYLQQVADININAGRGQEKSPVSLKASIATDVMEFMKEFIYPNQEAISDDLLQNYFDEILAQHLKEAKPDVTVLLSKVNMDLRNSDARSRVTHFLSDVAAVIRKNGLGTLCSNPESTKNILKEVTKSIKAKSLREKWRARWKHTLLNAGKTELHSLKSCSSWHLNRVWSYQRGFWWLLSKEWRRWDSSCRSSKTFWTWGSWERDSWKETSCCKGLSCCSFHGA
jgi:hypothetical protein